MKNFEIKWSPSIELLRNIENGNIDVGFNYKRKTLNLNYIFMHTKEDKNN